MSSLNNKCRLVLIMFFTIILFSCGQSDDSVKKSLVIDFSVLKPRLDTVIKYVVNKYYNNENIKNYNRLQFVLGSKNYHKRSIFSDTIVTKNLGETSIVDVSFEKGSFCLDKYAYDFVRFKIEARGYQYYYVYEFCPPDEIPVSSPNFESVPLSANWSLQIEKN